MIQRIQSREFLYIAPLNMCDSFLSIKTFAYIHRMKIPFFKNIEHFVLAFLAVFFIVSGLYSKQWWQQSRQIGDGLGYYVYLPSVLIHRDLGVYDKTMAALRKYTPSAPDFSADIYGFRKSPIGKLANKYPVGPAILQGPFFMIGHFYAKFIGGYDADGFSRPYQISAFFSTLFYVLIGLWFLSKLLRKYYSEEVAAITLLLLGVGTNLLFFTSFGSAMSHGYQFMAVSLVIYFSDQLVQKLTIKNAIGLGLSMGLVAIIRSQDLIVGLIPIFWAVGSIRNVSEKFQLILKNIPKYLVALFCFLLVFTIQLCYFKFISGQWYYYSYVGETFHWTKAQIANGLFDYQNGWFMYTPLMLVALLGVFLPHDSKKIWLLSLISVMCLHIYVSYSWWCWQYIAGMGSRPMVDMYALCAFALANVVAWSSRHIYARWAVGIVILFCVFQNLKFTYQQYNGIIFSEVNNKAYYRSLFLKIFPEEEDIIAFNTNYIQPDPTSLTLVDTLYQTDFESMHENIDTLRKTSGKNSLNMAGERVGITTLELDKFALKKGEWIKVTMHVYLESEWVWFGNLGKFVLAFLKNGESIAPWNDARPTAMYKNVHHTIWHSGQVGEWGQVSYYTQVPVDANEGMTLDVFGYNGGKVRWYIDDLIVEWYK